MDLSLPVMDGWEATRRLKADHRTRHIPVVALTGHALAGHSEGGARRPAATRSSPSRACPTRCVDEIRRMLDAPQDAEPKSGR